MQNIWEKIYQELAQERGGIKKYKKQKKKWTTTEKNEIYVLLLNELTAN